MREPVVGVHLECDLSGVRVDPFTASLVADREPQRVGRVEPRGKAPDRDELIVGVGNAGLPSPGWQLANRASSLLTTSSDQRCSLAAGCTGWLYRSCHYR